MSINIQVTEQVSPKNVATIDRPDLSLTGNTLDKKQIEEKITQAAGSSYLGELPKSFTFPTSGNYTFNPAEPGIYIINGVSLPEILASDFETYLEIIIRVTDGVGNLVKTPKPALPIKEQFISSDNINTSTMNAASKHFEGETLITSGTNAFESDLVNLSGALPVDSERVIIFKNSQTATEVYKTLNIKLGTAGKVQLEKYELINGKLERQTYQQFTNNLIVAENPVSLNENMRTYSPTEYFAVRFNTSSLLARLSYKQITNPDYQYGIHIGTETIFDPPTWRTDYRLGVQLIGEITSMRTKGAIETEIDRLVGKLVDINKLFSFFMDSVLPTLSKNLKPLTIIQFIGDSLKANALGGDIPNIEALMERPMRLGESNTLARRFYDLMSWNKPIWRRLDHSAWIKSKTGTTSHWNGINNASFFEPTYNTELYNNTNVLQAYAEIAVPAGNENFAVILRQGNSSGTVNFTLNGAPMPPENGISTFDTNLTGAGHTGNPYKVIQFNNLPTGQDNIIRITNTTASNIYVWGGLYWSGNTMIVMNSAHGGHNLRDLIDQKHLTDEVLRNDFDAYVFQLPEMNEMRQGSIEKSLEALQEVLDIYMKDKDVFFTSCNILGKNTTTGVNYYKTDINGNPWAFTQKELNTAFKQLLYLNKVPFVDIFKVFEHHTLAKGGTLENGDAGKLFTLDGQHGSPYGVKIWEEIEKPFYKQIPLYN